MRRAPAVRRAALVVAALAGGVLAAPVPAGARADAVGQGLDGVTVEAECSSVQPETTQPVATERDSAPLEHMEVDLAHERLERLRRAPGEGVVVAVIDSGVSAITGIPVVEHVSAGNLLPPEHYHGTAVAGLIAGPPRADGNPVGIAPAASILDVHVYDDPASADATSATPIRTENVVAGLDAVIERMPAMNIRVVTIALALPHDPLIRTRIDRLWKLGAVVVAPTGNRPGKDDEPAVLDDSFKTHHPGEDVAELIHPASYPRVLGVNASMTGMDEGTDPTAWVLESSATDVAAPTAGAVSYAVTGGTCLLSAPATSWATAEVSGVLALMQSVYDERPAQAVARLLATANGRTDVPNTLLGAGEVRANEALTRPLQIDDDGTVTSQGTVRDEPQQVAAPETPPDVLASTRRNAVWWGLLGGGTLLLALVLRPVLARRRARGH